MPKAEWKTGRLFILHFFLKKGFTFILKLCLCLNIGAPEPKEGRGSPGAGVTGGCELMDMGEGTKLRSSVCVVSAYHHGTNSLAPQVDGVLASPE